MEFLFFFYLTMLPVGWTTQYQMVGRLMANEMERTGTKQP
jgi:hypothetical protein